MIGRDLCRASGRRNISRSFVQRQGAEQQDEHQHKPPWHSKETIAMRQPALVHKGIRAHLNLPLKLWQN